MQNKNIVQGLEEEASRYVSTEDVSRCTGKQYFASSQGSEVQYPFCASINETEGNKVIITTPSIAKIVEDNTKKQDNFQHRGNSKGNNTDSTPSPLFTSYMHRRSSVATGKRSRAKEPKDSGTEMETLKSFNIPAYGDFLYTRVDVHFGNSPKPCTLLFDTGAGFTWINKELYETTTPSVGRRLRITVKIKYEFATEEDDIIGELYENSIWFGHGNPVNKKFVFAVVDELNQPLVSKLKWQRNILGILGFQPGEKPFFKQTSIEAPSASYMLLNKPTLYAPIMSIDFRMPKQKAYQSVSIRKIAAPGHIRIGEVESNASDPSHRHWIWHNATKVETPSGTKLLLPTIFYYTCGGTYVISEEYMAKIDTGARWIYLPRQEMNQYIQANNKILQYDDSLMLYYMSKENLKYLKEITFILNGTKYHLSKEALIIPQGLLEKYFGRGEKNQLYLIIQLSRSKLATTKKPMIILGHVWITRYDIVFDYGGSRIGLAEAEGKTDYTWDELH